MFNKIKHFPLISFRTNYSLFWLLQWIWVEALTRLFTKKSYIIPGQDSAQLLEIHSFGLCGPPCLNYSVRQ